jgi:hypothetical protein
MHARDECFEATSLWRGYLRAAFHLGGVANPIREMSKSSLMRLVLMELNALLMMRKDGRAV